MLGALIYLRLTSLKNWVRWRVRRLRQPKYLVGAIVGVAYFYFFFFRHVGGVRPVNVHAPTRGLPPVAAMLPTDVPSLGLAIGGVILLVILTLMWVIPTERAALGFTEAEIAFLFPAPLSRRALIHFRLISAQLRSLTAGLVMAMISNRWTIFGGNALTHAIGWWLVFSTLNLHFSGAKFTLTRLADRGLNVVVRRVLVFVALVAIAGFTLWQLPSGARWPNATGVSALRAMADWIQTVTNLAPLSWLLYPLRLVIGPFLAADTHRFLFALGPALAVIAVHYLWVAQAVVSFEDASIEQAERRAARIAAWRTGERRMGRLNRKNRRVPFHLADAGRPELAFLWKNLLAAWPYFNLRVLGVGAAVIVAASAWIRMHPRFAPFGVSAGWIATFFLAYILVIGPQFARQDIRSDLRKVDVLKTYPLAGWQIVLGELLTPAAILTGVQWLALLIAALNLEAGGATAWLTPSMRIAGGVAAAAIMPVLVTLQLFVPNAAALVFPSWFDAVRSRGGGPEVMGQRMIFFFAQLLTMVVMVLPAAVMGAVVIWILDHFIRLDLAIVIATVPVLGVLLAEVAGGLWWLGGRFEKIDVAEELRS